MTTNYQVIVEIEKLKSLRSSGEGKALKTKRRSESNKVITSVSHALKTSSIIAHRCNLELNS